MQDEDGKMFWGYILKDLVGWAKKPETWSFWQEESRKYFKQQNDMDILVIWKTMLIITIWRETNRIKMWEVRRLLLSSETIGTSPRAMAMWSQNEKYETFYFLQPLMESSMPTSRVLPCIKENKWPGTCWPWAKILTCTLSTFMQRASSIGWAGRRTEFFRGG